MSSSNVYKPKSQKPLCNEQGQASGPWAVVLMAVIAASCGASGGGEDAGADTSADVPADRRGLDAVRQDGTGEDAGDLASDGMADERTTEVKDLVPTDLPEVSNDIGLDTHGPDDVGVQDPMDEAALRSLFPLATHFEQKQSQQALYYEAFQGPELLGVAFKGASYGFNSEVVTMTGITSEGITVALATVSQWESWWGQVEWSDWFWEQFKGLTVADLDVENRSLSKSKMDPVDAVTGATYTSDAVISGFWQGIGAYLEFVGTP